MKPSVGKKIAIGYLIALPILLVLGLMQSQVLGNFNRVQQEAAQAAETLQEIEAVLAALRVAAAATEGRLPSKVPGIVSSPQEAQEATRQRLRHVRHLTEKNPRQTERLNTLEALVEKKFQSPAKEAVPRGAGKAVAESGKASQSIRQALTDDVRKVTDEMRAEEMSIVRERSTLARSLADKASSFTTLWGILALWLIALAALLLYRKSSEQKWAGIERRMNARILETIPVGVCMTDDSGIILYSNPAEGALLGYSQEELLGRYLVHLASQPDADRDRLLEEINDRLRAQGSWMSEFVAVRKDQSTFRCFARAVAVETPEKAYRVFVQEEVPDGRPTA